MASCLVSEIDGTLYATQGYYSVKHVYFNKVGINDKNRGVVLRQLSTTEMTRKRG